LASVTTIAAAGQIRGAPASVPSPSECASPRIHQRGEAWKRHLRAVRFLA
jgi:hypothetical protein